VRKKGGREGLVWKEKGRGKITIKWKKKERK
jgi:hypothetical protein